MSRAAWAGCLEEFGVHLERQRQALAEGRTSDIEAFTPPTGLPPMPMALRAQAERLLRESVALTGQLEQAARQVASQLRLVAALDSGATAGAGSSYIDTRG